MDFILVVHFVYELTEYQRPDLLGWIGECESAPTPEGFWDSDPAPTYEAVIPPVQLYSDMRQPRPLYLPEFTALVLVDGMRDIEPGNRWGLVPYVGWMNKHNHHATRAWGIDFAVSMIVLRDTLELSDEQVAYLERVMPPSMGLANKRALGGADVVLWHRESNTTDSLRNWLFSPQFDEGKPQWVHHHPRAWDTQPH